MSHSHAVARPIGTMTLPRRLRGLAGHVRLTVIVCLVLICGSFASAAMIQMRLDRTHALAQAAAFGERRAQEMATDLATALDRYRATGAAFASAEASAETSAALSEAGGAALRNIAVLDANGRIVSEMRGAPQGLLPLSMGALEQARGGRAIVASRDAGSIAILFAQENRIVAVQIDSRRLLSPAGM
ncbi:MAG TPA: hypothetical protein VG274_03490, partial [Rhizomicrobium sp.]|nr:hypothetical protein [Rhizomicrobium sp.]